MNFDVNNLSNLPFTPVVIAIVALWDGFWKAVGLWYAIKNHQRNWFVAMFLINSIGILPLIYLKFYQKKS
jgi:methionyl-tRNA synthetase